MCERSCAAAALLLLSLVFGPSPVTARGQPTGPSAEAPTAPSEGSRQPHQRDPSAPTVSVINNVGPAVSPGSTRPPHSRSDLGSWADWAMVVVTFATALAVCMKPRSIKNEIKV